MVELGQALWQLIVVLAELLQPLFSPQVLLLAAWLAWWLWAVNWTKAWAVLARGAWAPVVLLMFMASLVWSRIAPGECSCMPGLRVPNFWWQFGSVGLLGAITLFCGWLQGYFGWRPAEVNLEPPVVTHAHHDHDDPHHGPEHRDVEETPRPESHHHH